MKYYLLAGFVIAAAVIATLIADQPSEYSLAKRNAVEAENKVRPPQFEDLKFKPDAEVQLRAPASRDGK